MGRPIQFFLDTGCTMNLLNKQVFDRLPGAVRDHLEESDSHGLLNDGTRLPFYGMIRLTIRLKDVRTKEVFVVSRLSENAILGMPFFVTHQCSLEFEQSVVWVNGRQLVCTDRHEQLLQSKVQVLWEGGGSSPDRPRFPDGLPAANSLNQPGSKRQVIIRCMNATEQPLTFRSGATIGTYTGVDTPQVEDDDPLLYKAGPTSANEVPVHLKELSESARPHCEGASQTARLASVIH